MFTKPQVNKAEIDSFLSKIPDQYSVAATNNVGSHLSQRQVIYTIPKGINDADIVVFLVNKGDFTNEIKMIENNKNYRQLYKINYTFMVFEKQAAR